MKKKREKEIHIYILKREEKREKEIQNKKKINTDMEKRKKIQK